MERKVLLIGIVLMAVGLCGCQTEQAYQKPETQQIVSVEDYAVMTPEEQGGYRLITVESVKPEIIAKAETGLGAATGAYTVVKPLVPEPFATGGALFLTALSIVLGFLKNKKTQGVLDKVSLGAQITAKTIDNVVRPAVDVFNTFKEQQRVAENWAKQNGKSVIMPDDL